MYFFKSLLNISVFQCTCIVLCTSSNYMYMYLFSDKNGDVCESLDAVACRLYRVSTHTHGAEVIM